MNFVLKKLCGYRLFPSIICVCAQFLSQSTEYLWRSIQPWSNFRNVVAIFLVEANESRLTISSNWSITEPIIILTNKVEMFWLKCNFVVCFVTSICLNLAVLVASPFSGAVQLTIIAQSREVDD